MNSLAQLATCANELAADAKSLTTLCQDSSSSSSSETGSLADSLRGRDLLQPLVPHEGPAEVRQIKRSVLHNVSRLQTALIGPTEFIQQLACQNQLLACLQWLGEFQVLACIPLSCSVPIKDVSELAGVPENQLSRVVRMTATAGFLQEPQPGHIAHSPLSAPFVTKPSYLDAVMFLAGTAAPSALQMASATQRFGGQSQSPSESAYNIFSSTAAPFASICEQRPKLRRQWPAYLRYSTGDSEDGTVEVLTSLPCVTQLVGTSHSSIVLIGPKSAERAMALANHYPTLRFIAQADGTGSRPGTRSGGSPSAGGLGNGSKHSSTPSSGGSSSNRMVLDQTILQLEGRITIQQRVPGTPQPVRDAAVYVLNLPPSPSSFESSSLASSSSISISTTERVQAELRAHMDVLRANGPNSRLILTPHLLPEFGTVRRDAEAMALLRDLTSHQLTNQRDIEMNELVGIINGFKDNVGRLVLVNKLCSRTDGAVVLEVQYQAYENGY